MREREMVAEPLDGEPVARGASRERVWLVGGGQALVGVLTEPTAPRPPSDRPGFVFINAGVVHRVGPSRLYVNLARHLARQGFTSVRFDLSGIGDSPHRGDDLPAEESAVLEAKRVMTGLQAAHGLTSFVLVGLCSGAVTSFRTALGDDRVSGVILLNPQGFCHDPEWNAQVLSRTETRRYVANAMTDSGRWRRALSGRIDYRRLATVLVSRLTGWMRQRTRVSPVGADLARQFQTLAGRGVRLLVVCSEGDSSVDYMEAILGRHAVVPSRAIKTMLMRVFPKTDHSLTMGASQRALFALVDSWVGGVGT